MTPEQIAAMVNRLKLAKITGCRAAYALLGATPLDKINADIAAAADLIEAQAAELATLRAERDALREALSSRLNLWNRAEIQDGYILLWRDGDIIARLSFDMWNAGLEQFHQEAIVGDVLDAFQARSALKGGA